MVHPFSTTGTPDSREGVLTGHIKLDATIHKRNPVTSGCERGVPRRKRAIEAMGSPVP